MVQKNKFRLTPSLKLELKLTPSLVQTMKILQLSTLELLEYMKKELESNPFLEESEFEQGTEEDKIKEEKKYEQDSLGEEIVKKIEMISKWDNELPIDIDWIDRYTDTGADSRFYLPEDYDSTYYENVLAIHESIREHLIWQLRLSTDSKRTIKIADYIIGNVNDDGYLMLNDEEILNDLKSEITDISMEEIKKAIELLQSYEPIGVCAHNVRESLLLQLKMCGYRDSWAYVIIEDLYDDLLNQRIDRIKKILNITDEKLNEAIKLIRTLETKPGREFTTEEPVYVVPDVIIRKIDDKFTIITNDDILPKVRLNKYYREIMRKNKKNFTPEQRDFLIDKINNALLLIRSLHQRRRTIIKVTEAIFSVQGDFIEQGVKALNPLTLKEIAEIIKMHEATVSRITRNKFVQTPQGIYRLKYFFSSKLESIDGEQDQASKMVINRIKEIILNEEETLSDNDIVEMLSKENIKIARRTVAKYRNMLGISPSHIRDKKIEERLNNNDKS
jgi:RNA polymerase sigma-54 factor